MPESKSPVGEYHEMVDIWARIQAFDQVFTEIRTVQPASGNVQKINSVGCFSLCH